MKIDLLIDGRPHEIDGGELADADIREVEPGVYSVLLNGRSYDVKIESAAEGYYAGINGRRYAIQVRDPRRLARGRSSLEVSGRRKIASPMPGKIVRVLAREGDEVSAGQGLLVVEAMKMQNEIRSPKAGRIVAVFASEGAPVAGGETLAEVE